jgi:hypothetical protein
MDPIAIDRPCPKCGAKPGENCRGVREGASHGERLLDDEDLADLAWAQKAMLGSAAGNTARTACLTLLLICDPDILVGPDDLDWPLEDIAHAYPDWAADILALRDGGWKFTDALRQDGGATSGVTDQSILDTVVGFEKEIPSGKAADAAADVCRCGVSDPSFASLRWEEPRDTDDVDWWTGDDFSDR